jgi:hypothetical protein
MLIWTQKILMGAGLPYWELRLKITSKEKISFKLHVLRFARQIQALPCVLHVAGISL